MSDILVIHGPNLNLLGSREPDLYGDTTLDSVDSGLKKLAKTKGFTLEAVQSNAEHVLIDHVQRAATERVRFIIINPAAFTHTSVALKDALKAVNIPFIEVHISNIFAREEYRRHSYFSADAVGVITGLGIYGYELALQATFRALENNKA